MKSPEEEEGASLSLKRTLSDLHLPSFYWWIGRSAGDVI